MKKSLLAATFWLTPTVALAAYPSPTYQGVTILGTATAPTASPLTNNSQLGTTGYTDSAVGVEKTRAQGAESTNATAINSETSRAEAAEALKASLASPTFTGAPSLPTGTAGVTQAPGTSTTTLATTAFDTAAVGVETSRATVVEALKAPLASPGLTGAPTAPTASPLTSNGQLATTGYADSAVAVEKVRAQGSESTLTAAAAAAQSTASAALPLAGGTMTGALGVPSVAITGPGSTGDVSGMTVTVPGGSARTFANIIGADSTNILNILPQTSSSTDYTSAINTALAKTPIPVYLPNTGTPYKISGQLTLPANAQLICAPNTVLNITAAASSGWEFETSGSFAGITNCQFQGNSISVGLGLIQNDHFLWTNGGADHAGSIFVSGSGAQYDTFQNVKITYDIGTAIDVSTNAFATRVLNSEFENEAGFGIRADAGANGFLFQGNWTYGNGIELIGVTYQGHNGRIIGNDSEGTGDNGISVTGYDNVVSDNITDNDAFTGLYIYGSSNTGSGNKAYDNGRVHNPTSPFYNAANTNNYSGCEINGGFGGAGQNNNIACTGDDDQTTMTQAYGASLGSGYSNWAASTVYGVPAYVYSSSNIYETTLGGTSGATAPTCTSGTCSDGSVTWTFLAVTPSGTREPSGNYFAAHVNKALVQPFSDGTINHNNAVYADSFFNANGASNATSPVGNTVLGGLSRKVGTNWSSGMATTYGELAYTSSGSNLYRALNSGTSTIQPTQTSGTVTESDGVTWVYLNSGPFYQQLGINQQNVAPGNVLQLPVEETPGAACNIYAGVGSPLNKVAAPPCSMYLNASGGTSTTLYVKETGTGSAGWVAK